MKTFRKRQIWKACKMSPTGKSNWIRKQYLKATSPSWLAMTYIAANFIAEEFSIWDAVCKPHEREE